MISIMYGIVRSGYQKHQLALNIEDALRGRTTARSPFINGHGFDSRPSCLATADKHLCCVLVSGKDLV